MIIQKFSACSELIAGDGTHLRELLHPNNLPLPLRYSFAHGIVPVGKSSIPHSLTSSEVYYILSGQGDMHIDNETQAVETGDTIYVPPNTKQYLDNRGTEPLVFLCIVDPYWREENETVYGEEL
ncbi:MAG: cupin domain-containing protein [Okeania sp. SIO3I5]|uniref:cupin domain-containing protein n=1 Tax=Okeania sp. SIO3I5 TaxID=2607805 RepID=UPI0013B7C311|nr:cupin domain-containing protein [Okeania sp. SIO3I5]NEQ38953.1 cupin domain-containing protein [Okeania sp. SIO3I5]